MRQEIQDQKLNEEMIRAKGEIYASVLHDINGPLTVISGFIDMINRSMENSASVDGEKLETIKDDLSKLTTQVGRCFEISRRYLSFLNKNTEEQAPVGVNQILSDVKELLIRHPAIRGNELAVNALDTDTLAEINGTDLLQVLLNLTINALQSTDKPHRVEIRAAADSQVAGPGSIQGRRRTAVHQPRRIPESRPARRPLGAGQRAGHPPELFGKMFEEKFTTKPADKGTGLGLSIIKRLVKEANGGDSPQVQARPGNGDHRLPANPSKLTGPPAIAVAGSHFRLRACHAEERSIPQAMTTTLCLRDCLLLF